MKENRITIYKDDKDYLGMSIFDIFEYLELEFGFDFSQPYKVERFNNGLVISQTL